MQKLVFSLAFLAVIAMGASAYFAEAFNRESARMSVDAQTTQAAAVADASAKIAAETEQKVRREMTVDWPRARKAARLFNWANSFRYRGIDTSIPETKSQIRRYEILILEQYILWKQFEHCFRQSSEGTQDAIFHMAKMPEGWVCNKKEFSEFVYSKYCETDGLSAMSIVDDGVDYHVANRMEVRLKRRGLLLEPIAWDTEPPKNE